MTIQADNFYQNIFANTVEGLIVVGKSGEIELVNPKSLEMFGYDSEEELKGKLIEVLIPKRYHGVHVGNRQEFTKKSSTRPMGIGKVLYAIKKNGEEFPVEVSLSPCVNDQGEKSIIAFVSDITDRIKAQKALEELNNKLESLVERRSLELRRSNQLYESISKNFPKGCIYVFDRSYNYIFAEGKELNNRGLKGRDLLGHNYLDLLSEEVRDIVKPQLDEVFKGKEASFEISYKSATFKLRGVPLENEIENIIDRILVVESDITGEKEIQKEIEGSLEKERELNLLKSRFITLVSHEFRTPLSAIKSSAQLINHYTKEEDNDKRIKHTNRIESSVNHLNQMIEDILSLSKIEEGKTEMNLEDFQMDELIQNLLQELGEIYPENKVNSELKPVCIKSDKKLIKHIAQNIIGNAFKYTPDGKSIRVSLKEKNQQIILEVEDEGIGIPKEDQAKLFERFHRATNVSNIKGTGLGLNIVQKYLDQLYGTISFQSEVNKGSKFVIKFPKKLDNE